MKCIKVDLPDNFNYIEIEPIFDLHIGSKKCNYKEIKQRIERIQNNDNVYAILGGDIINNSTINSIAGQDVYEEPLTPTQQIQQASKLLYPIKDKIIGACSGNHERRSMKDGIDLDYFLCKELGIQDRYDFASALLFIRFGKSDKHKRKLLYTCFFYHGSGGGGQIGSKANKLAKTGQIVNADIVLVGHTHAPLTFKECNYEIDPQNSSVYLKETTFVNAGATVEYETYAEINGLKPQSNKTPVIRLNGKKKEIVVIS